MESEMYVHIYNINVSLDISSLNREDDQPFAKQIFRIHETYIKTDSPPSTSRPQIIQPPAPPSQRIFMSTPNPWQTLLGLSDSQSRARKREWNRNLLTDLFPRIPTVALDRILDICVEKGFTYNLSESKQWSSRRLTSIVIAHVRHAFSDYDKLLREERVERYEARKQTAGQVWKTLREWCPWDSSNEVLARCFEVTLVRPEERGTDWDPMDIDSDSEVEVDDPMEID